MRKIDRTGEINYNRYGSKMTIVEYNNKRNIVVEFDNGFKKKGDYGNFKKGKIKNPYDKAIYGIGYIGDSEFKLIDNTMCQYRIWNHMLRRCYDDEYQEKHPTYKGCEVCEEWHNFQVFSKWYENNYYEIENETMNLDKDILHKGNKLYSGNNCVFVSQRINKLFTKREGLRGEFPIGVSFHKIINLFQANCNVYNNEIKNTRFIGYFNTPTDAFYLGYKPFKEKYIKEVADEYKTRIPEKLYDAMYNYIVEITD